MADYAAWLIEMNEASGPVYHQFIMDDDWTKDHNNACHFARKQDAEQVISYYGWTYVKAIQHMWSPGKSEASVSREDIYKVAIDQAKQIKNAGGEISYLRLALMSMMDHEDPETLRGMAARILDRSRERWPPQHSPHHSFAALGDPPADLSDGLPHLNRNE